MKKRILSLLLVAVLLVSLAPMAAFADMMVYITADDMKYHNEGCKLLSGDDGLVPVSIAIEEGYAPCSECGALDPRTATKYAVTGGSLYFDKATGTIFDHDGDITAAVIPSEIGGVKVTSIGSWALAYCENIESLTIPDTVTQIGSYAFCGSSLESIVIPDSVRTVGEGAFQYCILMQSITLPKGLTEISPYALQYCAQLQSVSIPAGVKAIGEGAFQYCASITGIDVPKGVTEIGDGAFEGCSAVETITLPESLKEIGDAAFSDCYTVKELHFAGSYEQWRTVSIGADNDPLVGAKLYFGGVEHKHSFSKTVLSEPGCTASGKTEFTCGCGMSYIENQPKALGHDYVRGVCSRCGAKDPAYKPPVTVSFTDVPATAFYYEPVRWAVENGITTGVGSNRFDPDGYCTRGQVVTFLWRAAGKPAVSSNVSFTDVKPGAYYYEAVKWAVENGITQGVGGNKFDPDGLCTRGQVVTFLHRAAKTPGTGAQSSFSDVPTTAFYYNAVNWAVGKGITNGTGGGKFSPNDTCTRGQVVTFLYRAFSEAN